MVVAANAFLSSVSCTSSTHCVAAGGTEASSGPVSPALVATFDGSKWSRPLAVGQGFTLGSVSYPSPRFCVAGAGSPGDPTGPGDVLTYNGSRWSSALKIDSAPLNDNALSCPIPTLSCRSSSLCFAANLGAKVYQWRRSDGSTT